jgi:hypothetical protein
MCYATRRQRRQLKNRSSTIEYNLSFDQLHHFRRIASYNWLDASYPGDLPFNTMIIPGVPPICLDDSQQDWRQPLKVVWTFS